MEQLERLKFLNLAQYADDRINDKCSCGDGVRTVRCADCTERPPLCVKCWIRAHDSLPFHWAEEWDEVAGYFKKRDISDLDKNWALHLGHRGERCPKPAGKPRLLTVVDENGPHASRAVYCGCRKMDKEGGEVLWEQLFEVRLWPGTVKVPRTAYTFRAMRAFEIHSAASKKSAHDYCKALCQMANRAFPEENPVSSRWCWIQGDETNTKCDCRNSISSS